MSYFGLSDTGMFGELRVSEGYQIIELKSTYGLSALRDVQTVANTGAISNSGGEYLLSTGTTASSTAQLDSAERGRYIPGVEAQAGIGVRIDHTFTSDQFAEWGYFDDNDGIGFGEDATGKYVFYLRNGTQTKIYQSNWNVDEYSDLDFASGTIFEIDFTWYGYGQIEWRVIRSRANDGKQQIVPVHRFTPDGQNSIQDPNLPIRAFVSNGTTTTDIDLYVGGRQFSVFTQYDPNRRVNGDYRLEQSIAGGTAFIPTVSFRRKSGAKNLGVSVKLEGISIISDTDLIWEVRLGNGLTGASFGDATDVSPAETAVETDTSATALTGGEFIDGGFINTSGTGSKATGSGNEGVLIDIPATNNLTLCVRPVDGSTASTVSTFLRWKEEW